MPCRCEAKLGSGRGRCDTDLPDGEYTPADVAANIWLPLPTVDDRAEDRGIDALAYRLVSQWTFPVRVRPSHRPLHLVIACWSWAFDQRANLPTLATSRAHGRPREDLNQMYWNGLPSVPSTQRKAAAFVAARRTRALLQEEMCACQGHAES